MPKEKQQTPNVIANKTLPEILDLVRAMEERFGLPTGAFGTKEIHEKESEINRIVKYLYGRIKQLKNTIEVENNERIMTAMSLGLPIDDIKIYRFVAVSIFLEDASKKSQSLKAIKSFLSSLSVYPWREKPDQEGSWFKSLIGFFKNPSTKKEVEDTLRLGARALELQQIQKYQAETDKSLCEAAAILHSTLKEQENACVVMGSIIYLKTKENGIQIRSLTPRQMIDIENNPDLRRNPILMFESLKIPASTHQILDIHDRDPIGSRSALSTSSNDGIKLDPGIDAPND